MARPPKKARWATSIAGIDGYSLKNGTAFVSGITENDKNLPIQVIRGLFEETVDRDFQNFYIIATDVSKDEQLHLLQDEVEKLAYQLNEEAERTERPIRRLSKVMYGSTCADMQVDVMGECLSSIKHVVGTTSGCFYPRSNHWEVWRDNEWGRVLFTDESRFSLSSDSHRILIWRERGSHNHPSNIIERDRYGGRGVLVWGGIMLCSRTDLHIFDAGSVNGTRYCNEILLPYVRLFRGTPVYIHWCAKIKDETVFQYNFVQKLSK
ncbi:DDE_3 domain-containing protein [Trichonephila clavipes]|nr:DDE_3 domain-containing protein [Trichonephila clavipes]